MKPFAALIVAFALVMAMPLAAQDVPAVIDGSGTNRIQVVSDFEFSTAVSGSARVVLERTLADEATGGARTVALTGPNDSSGGMELWGSADRPLVVTITNVTTMPLSGGIDIHTNASLRLAASSSNGKPLSNSDRKGSTITVHEGGSLVQPYDCKFGVLPHNHSIVLDGGVLKLNDGRTPTSISAKLASIVINDLTFKNGGRFENGRPYVGLSAGGTWRVNGSSAVSCPEGVTVSGYSYLATGDINFTLSVDDVTNDDAADFSIGVLRRPGSNDNYQANKPSNMVTQSNKVVVVKAGAGTLEFAGSNTYVGPTQLNDGTLRLGVTKCLDYSYMLNMNGGSLVACANTTNVIKKLKVSKDGGIALEGGALLTVNAIDSWSSGKTITVDVPNGAKRLRFASKTGDPVVLTEAQLDAIRTADGRRVMQDEEGWVRPRSSGVILIVM